MMVMVIVAPWFVSIAVRSDALRDSPDAQVKLEAVRCDSSPFTASLLATTKNEPPEAPRPYPLGHHRLREDHPGLFRPESTQDRLERPERHDPGSPPAVVADGQQKLFSAIPGAVAVRWR